MEYNSQNLTNEHGNNFQDYEHFINFVDSPPNSKESYLGDSTSDDRTQGPTIIDVRTIYSNSSNRKRRMDWSGELDLQQGTENNREHQTLSNQNNLKTTNVVYSKDLEKKQSIVKGTWSDGIDFDLNNDFSQSGYLNNADSFLSFSNALSALKREIPSPKSVKQSKGNKSPLQLPQIQEQEHHQLRHQSQTSLKNDHLQHANDFSVNTNNISPNNSENISSQHHPEIQRQQKSRQSTSQLENGSRNSKFVSTDLQSLVQSENFNNVTNSRKLGDIKIDTTDDSKFQYILAAATSIATKSNEETLTYLNQRQSYEIKLKKIGDLSYYRDKMLKSVIKICFHERRLQYMEREQMLQWQSSHPGERIIEVDVPLSYGLCQAIQPLSTNFLNTVEILWDPMKEVGVYIKVNCISTEFTPKKHGGEKGVPFRIQIETYLQNNNSNNINKATSTSSTDCNSSLHTNCCTNEEINSYNFKKLIHAAACQIKVFKLKGADRKHKQDREKIHKRPVIEQDKYQPSYECTILNDISLDSISTSECNSPEYVKFWQKSPVHTLKYENVLPSPIAINNVTSSNTCSLQLLEQNLGATQKTDAFEDNSGTITKESTTSQVSQWLTSHRLKPYLGTFAQFSGADILRMSKEDLIQVCGLADGIRMYNSLHAKAIKPRLTIYISFDGSSYHAIYLTTHTIQELTQKVYQLPGFFEMCANSGNENNLKENGFSRWGMHSKYSESGYNIHNDSSVLNIYTTGPSGIHVIINEEVLSNAIKDNNLYSLEILNGKILLKTVNKIDI